MTLTTLDLQNLIHFFEILSAGFKQSASISPATASYSEQGDTEANLSVTSLNRTEPSVSPVLNQNLTQYSAEVPIADNVYTSLGSTVINSGSIPEEFEDHLSCEVNPILAATQNAVSTANQYSVTHKKNKLKNAYNPDRLVKDYFCSIPWIGKN